MDEFKRQLVRGSTGMEMSNPIMEDSYNVIVPSSDRKSVFGQSEVLKSLKDTQKRY